MTVAQAQAQWVDCVVDSDYEINVNYPYAIRRKSNGRIVRESDNGTGYPRIKLHRKDYLKHRVVATQFIENPHNYTEVDHVNHDRTDYHIENLRWVSRSQNVRNKKSYNGIIVEYLDELSENAFEVTEYNEHEFEDLWFDPATNCFYYYTGAAYREIIYLKSTASTLRIQALDINHVRATISLNKFKRVYELP